ncbi:MurA [Desulforapulum autotrophicum HRM2]|uniref:UDP-N-acetylglucosamine 1-carboxyvinyltransferase n=1 Tax=Desulforapulum autotrophicum (strain ATCC 43914 / DSM 3382 / VKM B-1955 / HRM2) TaxID=177437 RepID=MURA_DESAH|nr:UDP-N-acetylglucosamine 1-carboxyvinyltransferase [Desulforapulum autotrophicum]C0QDM7.1 RecName: Full=UDP-N-acetylglucosamine 1-carboxyvinyltransferase; AltName: Full=Enoylpyruvate transferase; AltName: Full=UDP-N-acetylglucosamine enolpyruvyl transferase; Short=EPT [Desulforapulum autotrophicum HRM2]ACN15291.1 MurA [Desulforapulum autotrophicum HRM2]
MDKIEIRGGKRLTGEVRISGAKNAALPLLASSILVDGAMTFTNVPDLVDVRSIKMLLRDLGAGCEEGEGTVLIDGSGIHKIEAAYELVRKMRASILVLGPLVARFGHARVSLPGGCAIGARPVDMHLKGLKALGATITIENGYIEAKADRLKGNEIYFDIPTVTGTENLMMAATLAKGTTVLRNCAREPEITALANALNLMGARVTGAGTAVIRINGVDGLSPATIHVIPDRIEAGTFMVAAAATGGDVLVTGCEPENMGGIINKLRQTGALVEIIDHGVKVSGGKSILSTDIKTLPYPGFPTDMQAQFMVLMAISQGNSVIHETIFENRFMHVNELQRMGADISISGGNYAMVRGVNALSGAEVMASDLRASASLVIAGLVARGVTTIHRVYHIDRGYEALEKKFSALGADIKRVK